MGLLSQKSKKGHLYDPIRKKWVIDTPEEKIRQHLIRYMIESLGYPSLWLAIEKELAQLPHLQNSTQQIVKRRADILVFAPSTLLPLLLIECKAIDLCQNAIQQVVGYNDTVQARYISLANNKEIITGHYNFELKKYIFNSGLPDFVTLSSLSY